MQGSGGGSSSGGAAATTAKSGSAAATTSGGAAATNANGSAAANAQGTPAVTNADGSAATTAAQNGGAADASTLPSDAAGVLSLYTTVLNQFKSSAPAYNKVEYQTLPDEYKNLGSLGNVILKIASGMMTTQEKAESSPQTHNKGDSMDSMPILNNTAGCLLTDTSAIKSFSCKDNGDGTATIIITLNDEDNPEPAEANSGVSPSFTGAMFAPMSKANIDSTVAGISAITVNSLFLTYTDCTATLTFDKATNNVTNFEQIMNVDIKANVTGLKVITIDGSARFVDTMKCYNIAY